jgi:hypothetical protein
VPTQNLSFATYGPNNQDQDSQHVYRRTLDDTYIEPLPNGEVIAFKVQNPDGRAPGTAPKTDPLWGQRFSSPMCVIAFSGSVCLPSLLLWLRMSLGARKTSGPGHMQAARGNCGKRVAAIPSLTRYSAWYSRNYESLGHGAWETGPILCIVEVVWMLVRCQLGFDGREKRHLGFHVQSLWRLLYVSLTRCSPSVAIFDVVRSPGRAHPFVLLQPRPRLDDTLSFYDLSTAARRNSIDTSSAYVGLVEETGSLYALSPDHYSLVIFGTGAARKSIDPAPGSMPSTAPNEIVDRAELCARTPADRRCATGLRQLGEDSRSRIARLLDSAPVAPQPVVLPRTNSGEHEHPPAPVDPAPPAPLDNHTLGRPWPAPPHPALIGDSAQVWGMSGILALLACCMFGLGTLWASRRRPVSYAAPASVPAAPTPAAPAAALAIQALGAPAVQVPASDTSLPLLEIRSERTDDAPSTASSSSPPTPPSPAILLSAALNGSKKPTPSPIKHIALPAADTLEDAEDDSDKDGETPVQGRRKGTRRKRGKRKKTAAKDVFAETEGEGGEEDGVALPALSPLSPGTPSLIISPTPVPPVAPSLTVTDSVLGAWTFILPSAPAHHLSQALARTARSCTRARCRAAR